MMVVCFVFGSFMKFAALLLLYYRKVLLVWINFRFY